MVLIGITYFIKKNPQRSVYGYNGFGGPHLSWQISDNELGMLFRVDDLVFRETEIKVLALGAYCMDDSRSIVWIVDGNRESFRCSEKAGNKRYSKLN